MSILNIFIKETAMKQARTDNFVMTFGTERFCNVRTLKESGKLIQVVKEVEEYRLDVLTVTEVSTMN